jgi:hypothetical protein
MPKKKTDFGEICGNAGEKEISLKSLGSDEVTHPISRVLNGNQEVVDISLKQTVKADTLEEQELKLRISFRKTIWTKGMGSLMKISLERINL